MSGNQEQSSAQGTYGGCEGSESEYIKLISSDGHEFIVRREHAFISETIKAMLSGPGQFTENETNEINLQEIPSHCVKDICRYFTYRAKYTGSTTQVPEFNIDSSAVLELLLAAHFLDC